MSDSTGGGQKQMPLIGIEPWMSFTCICGDINFRPHEYKNATCRKCGRRYFFGYQEFADENQSTIVITAVLITPEEGKP